jgi:hypothetical protein
MLAMALAFPGIVFYGIALFAVQEYIKDEKHKRIYHYHDVEYLNIDSLF